MPRLTVSRLSMVGVIFVLVLGAVAPEQAFGPPPMQAPQMPPAPTPPPQTPAAEAAPAPPVQIPLDLFQVPDGFEVTLWASTPLLHNPTNIDIDRDGRIWVAEGVRYRSHHRAPARRRPHRRAGGHRSRRQGRRDAHLRAGARTRSRRSASSVIDNKIVVSQPPDLIVYTDVDRNRASIRRSTSARCC